ncbi:sensor histidine kinase, partial [Deinococcus sedimenti]|uniref:sensor histidine kinase n=1 Tax=Deinococcus sedimenti TaxID=1867090 RepID=UPI00227D85E8
DILSSSVDHTELTLHQTLSSSGDHWQLRSHRGPFRNPNLLTVLQRGLPRGQTLNVDRPYATRAPHYQDHFDPASVAVARHDISDVQASASFPVQSAGRVRGVLVIGRYEATPWTRVNRRLLDTVLSSLQLALERAEHAQTLQRRTQDLERSNAELEQFAYVASHDLQEPLRTITSFAELLVRRFNTDQDPRVQQYVEHISSGTTRMQQLIQDLLSFARVTSQREAPRPTDPGAVLTQLRADLAAPLRDSGGILSAGPLPPVMTSATQLRRLLQNLIGNALKFQRPGTPPHVHVSAHYEGEFVRFDVQDNGIGIAPEYQDRIFTIFQRLHGRDEYPGTGIGLSVARRIVEGHGGRMGVHSTPGQGTTFWFTLPAVPNAAAADAPADPVPPGPSA